MYLRNNAAAKRGRGVYLHINAVVAAGQCISMRRERERELILYSIVFLIMVCVELGSGNIPVAWFRFLG